MNRRIFALALAATAVAWKEQPRRNADGSPVYVGDFRGAQERNAMRYYLAITAYLESLSAPPARQFEMRLAIWYASSARYSPQLHEGREYLDIRRRVARESKLAARQPS